MPTVLKIGPYRFFFYSADRGEPVHVHIRQDDKVAKYWINPVRLASNVGFNAKTLRDLEKLVVHNSPEIRSKWNEFFTNS